MDTIFAQATAPGKAGVAVIRISGPEAFRAGSELCGVLPTFRMLALRTIRNLNGTDLDEGLVVCFPEGASFTGEAVVELQVHGSIAVVQAILGALGSIQGVRPAEAGEFTRRALDNFRLDLAQVEGLADLIDAETELQRQQAQEILSGALSAKVETWRRQMLEASALLEVTLDFPDEDVPEDVGCELRDRLRALARELRGELAKGSAAERIRDGFEVAIMGAPNVGKSTLLNAIARRQVALTSEIAGTTRDVLEVRVDLAGLPVTFLDTAGLRSTVDPLETAGIELARSRAAGADVRVWLSDEMDDAPRDCDYVIRCKDDSGRYRGVSGLTGAGIETFLADLEARLRERIPRSRLLVRARHRDAIQRAVGHLDDAMSAYTADIGTEVVALELQHSSKALAEIIGGIDVEDLLDDIFQSFCIGK
jgi:tRNA modification GTPase